jgi:hypothetical protein
MRAKLWAVLAVGVALLAGCGSGPSTTSSAPNSAAATTTPLGPPPGWIDPGTSIPFGPEATQVATPTDCSAESLQTIMWRGWDSAEGVNSRAFVVVADTVRFTADGDFAVFRYTDTSGRFPDAELIGDCTMGSWQLAGAVDEIDCATLDRQYMAIYAAAIRELGVC